MKAFWKAMGVAALAALVPVNFKKDEKTGKKTYQSLLISVDVGPGKDDVHTDIGINIGEGLLTDLGRRFIGSKREAAMFADDEPDAAVVAADELQMAVDVQTIANEIQAADGEAEATEADFDPEI